MRSGSARPGLHPIDPMWVVPRSRRDGWRQGARRFPLQRLSLLSTAARGRWQCSMWVSNSQRSLTHWRTRPPGERLSTALPDAMLTHQPVHPCIPTACVPTHTAYILHPHTVRCPTASLRPRPQRETHSSRSLSTRSEHWGTHRFDGRGERRRVLIMHQVFQLHGLCVEPVQSALVLLNAVKVSAR
jgi:hypothetical protein